MPPDLENILACPRCHSGLERRHLELVCACGFVAAVADRTVDVRPRGTPTQSVFDKHYPVMMQASADPHSRRVFYDRQGVIVQSLLGGCAKVILDVGCGPQLQYEKPTGSLVLGLDPSYGSLCHNRGVDVRLWGSAVSLPLPAESVDVIICLYSLHHLVGPTAEETKGLVAKAFAEFRRVLRHGGQLLVFEVVPWWPAWIAQRLAWSLGRQMLWTPLNAFFWRRNAFDRFCQWPYKYRVFSTSPFLTFPFAFTLPWLRLPRLLYPFTIAMFHWRMP